MGLVEARTVWAKDLFTITLTIKIRVSQGLNIHTREFSSSAQQPTMADEEQRSNIITFLSSSPLTLALKWAKPPAGWKSRSASPPRWWYADDPQAITTLNVDIVMLVPADLLVQTTVAALTNRTMAYNELREVK
jgi:hypothetical protein